MNNNDKFHGTTIVGVRRGKEVVVGGDGQVTLGNTVMKNNAKKVRRLYKDNVIAGFAGATADAFTLFEKFEKILRNLEALLIVADKEVSLLISGNGDVIEPQDSIIAIGSGGSFAQSAAKALYDNTELSAEEIVKKSLTIASDICIYTNSNLTIEKINV